MAAQVVKVPAQFHHFSSFLWNLWNPSSSLFRFVWQFSWLFLFSVVTLAGIFKFRVIGPYRLRGHLLLVSMSGKLIFLLLLTSEGKSDSYVRQIIITSHEGIPAIKAFLMWGCRCFVMLSKHCILFAGHSRVGFGVVNAGFFHSLILDF